MVSHNTSQSSWFTAGRWLCGFVASVVWVCAGLRCFKGIGLFGVWGRFLGW